MKSKAAPSGVMLYAKLSGPTSFSSLWSIKHALGTDKVGHTGTLDSFADGLLVVLSGSLTHIVPHITGFRKTYLAVVCFGSETDTLDPTGDVVGKKICEWKKESSSKGVDLNFFADNDRDGAIHGYANLVDNPDDTFVVGGHGSTRVFQDRNYEDVSPEKLAELVKNNPNYRTGMNVKLISCNLGGKTSGYENYAQRFANAMGKGVKVYGAPFYFL